MTISTLRALVFGVRCHDLTETNIDGLTMWPTGINFHTDTRDDALTELAEMRESQSKLEAEFKELEAEAIELGRMVDDMEVKLADTACADYPETMRDLAEDRDRWREACKQWAQAHERMQYEVTALRKRKGVSVGICAFINEVMDVVRTSTTPGAKALREKLSSY